MATPIASQVNSATGFGTSVSVSFPAACTAGNLCVYGSAGDDDATLSPSATAVTIALDANFLASELSYITNCPATVNTVTRTDSLSANGNMSLSCQEYSGSVTVSPADKVASNSGFGTAATSTATAVLAQANELVVGITSATAALTFTPGGTYTERVDTGSVRSHEFEDKNVSSTSAVTADSTLSTTSHWHCLCATFKDGAAAVAAGIPLDDNQPMPWQQRI